MFEIIVTLTVGMTIVSILAGMGWSAFAAERRLNTQIMLLLQQSRDEVNNLLRFENIQGPGAPSVAHHPDLEERADQRLREVERQTMAAKLSEKEGIPMDVAYEEVGRLMEKLG